MRKFNDKLPDNVRYPTPPPHPDGLRAYVYSDVSMSGDVRLVGHASTCFFSDDTHSAVWSAALAKGHTTQFHEAQSAMRAVDFAQRQGAVIAHLWCDNLAVVTGIQTRQGVVEEWREFLGVTIPIRVRHIPGHGPLDSVHARRHKFCDTRARATLRKAIKEGWFENA